MRADRLLSLALLLQARGAATARSLAAELGVSVRTVYRDLEALSAAGVPVVTEAGPGGGCRLMDGYRFPLRGLRPDEAEALLILGVPTVLDELGLAGALTAAHRQIQVTAGLTAAALVHLDMPRWFGGQEEVPCLRDLAQALRQVVRAQVLTERDGKVWPSFDEDVIFELRIERALLMLTQADGQFPAGPTIWQARDKPGEPAGPSGIVA